MTYQEYYEVIYQEYKEASEEFLKLDKELFDTRGFGDVDAVPNYAKAKRKWQVATNTYNNFLTIFKQNNASRDDQFIIS